MANSILKLISPQMKKERKDKSFIKKPIYPGGSVAMRNFIRQHLVYPPAALEKGIEGTVTMKYTIDHHGNVIDTHLIAGLGHGCDEEAARVVRLFKFDVSKTRGVRVTFHKDLHVHFRLPKKQPAPLPVASSVNTHYVYTQTPKPATPSNSGYSFTITITPSTKIDE